MSKHLNLWKKESGEENFNKFISSLRAEKDEKKSFKSMLQLFIEITNRVTMKSILEKIKLPLV